jgi:hypothetical protein
VYETTLASLAAMPQAYTRHAAPLALAFATLEASRRESLEARPRALHVLTWLGTGAPFTKWRPPPKGGPEGAAGMPAADR